MFIRYAYNINCMYVYLNIFWHLKLGMMIAAGGLWITKTIDRRGKVAATPVVIYRRLCNENRRWKNAVRAFLLFLCIFLSFFLEMHTAGRQLGDWPMNRLDEFSVGGIVSSSTVVLVFIFGLLDFFTNRFVLMPKEVSIGGFGQPLVEPVYSRRRQRNIPFSRAHD